MMLHTFVQSDMPDLSGLSGSYRKPDKTGQGKLAKPDKTGRETGQNRTETGQPDFGVLCPNCRNFKPDPINPADGLGDCSANSGGRLPWPNSRRPCPGFEISRPALFLVCKKAVSGTSVDPSALCQFLTNENDPGWTTARAVRRWVELIETNGGFPE
jgi:hypothetical protein